MAKRFTREQVLEKLNTNVKNKNPILGVGAGNGLVARCADVAGADLIIVYPSGRARHLGIGTAIIGDPNTITLDMTYEIMHVVKNTPLIAGIYAKDKTRDANALLSKFKELGYSGVINYPSVCHYGEEYAEIMTASGWGYNKERKVLLDARSMGLLTMTYVYRKRDAKHFADAADIVIPHVGWTAGGLDGSKYAEKIPLSKAAEIVQEMARSAKDVNPEVIVLCHGGPIVGPKETEYIYENTDVVGFVGGSSTERIPIEKAIMGIVEEFKSVSIR